MLNKNYEKIVLKSTGSKSLELEEVVQELWSGYGKILRYNLSGGKNKSAIVKYVTYPNRKNHPRGWNTGLSHSRKLKSYKVETAWYQKWAKYCGENSKIPYCYTIESSGDETLMVMEDLDVLGYPLRKTTVSWIEIKACLKWLANFHATFLGEQAKKLWKVGTYWHLDTRPDELKALDDAKLKKYAGIIDQKLKNGKYKTFVHGDAKLANFCFSSDGTKVAAVDFQYVGAGCGMKDIAYFVGSCLHEDECEQLEQNILDYYFEELKEATQRNNKEFNFDELEEEWRAMYHLAWTDFHRFLKGWSPGHWKINSYSEKVLRKVCDELEKSKGDSHV